MGDCIDMSISGDSLSDETLNWGPWRCSYDNSISFPLGLIKCNFPLFSFNSQYRKKVIGNRCNKRLQTFNFCTFFLSVARLFSNRVCSCFKSSSLWFAVAKSSLRFPALLRSSDNCTKDKKCDVSTHLWWKSLFQENNQLNFTNLNLIKHKYLKRT